MRIGLDIWADLGTPRLTYRRLRLLLERAPRDSEYVREKAGASAAWDDEEHLLAIIADRLEVLTYQFVSANTPKGKTPPAKPVPLPRPGHKAKQSRRTELSSREIGRRLVQMHRMEVARGRS